MHGVGVSTPRSDEADHWHVAQPDSVEHGCAALSFIGSLLKVATSKEQVLKYFAAFAYSGIVHGGLASVQIGTCENKEKGDI